MSRGDVSLEAIVTGLKSEGLLDENSAARADALIAQLRGVQPWYVRAMVGFGAWLASLLLIAFVAGFGMLVGGYALVGIGLVVAAILLRRQFDNDFMVQATLAASLAGQALFAWGITELTPGSDEEMLFAIVTGVSTALFFIFPDRIHRVLSVLFAASAFTLLVYTLELNAVVPVLGPVFAGALVLLQQKRARLTAGGYGHFVRPLANGLMLASFGCLLLSTIYLLPELGAEFAFYPRPWISTLLLGALFLYVGSLTWPSAMAGAGKAAAPIAYGLMFVVIACAWLAPGLLLALTVVLLGTATGNRSFIGAGIAFLVVFVTAYFYGIEMTMLEKSITLVATGAAVLFARWLLLEVLEAPAAGGLQHG
jgi:hypothetical protein